MLITLVEPGAAQDVSSASRSKVTDPWIEAVTMALAAPGRLSGVRRAYTYNPVIPAARWLGWLASSGLKGAS